jgi:hypothetical protein
VTYFKALPHMCPEGFKHRRNIIQTRGLLMEIATQTLRLRSSDAGDIEKLCCLQDL